MQTVMQFPGVKQVFLILCLLSALAVFSSAQDELKPFPLPERDLTNFSDPKPPTLVPNTTTKKDHVFKSDGTTPDWVEYRGNMNTWQKNTADLFYKDHHVGNMDATVQYQIETELRLGTLDKASMMKLLEKMYPGTTSGGQTYATAAFEQMALSKVEVEANIAAYINGLQLIVP